jgi:hypothetical protein
MKERVGRNNDQIRQKRQIVPCGCPNAMHLFVGFNLVTTLSKRTLAKGTINNILKQAGLS